MTAKTKRPGYKTISIFFLCSIFIPLAQAAAFTDINSNYQYSTAINYLADAGIIKGYPDGTFKPEQNVNRVEFLKLAIESSGIKTDITDKSGFTDIDENAWYAKYVDKAKKEGWIQGYTDNTFRPTQNINKVEALKIIGKIQNWQLPVSIAQIPYLDTPAAAWFTPYIIFAKDRNFLEETGKTFIPDAMYTRAKISELLFRTFITAKSGSINYTSGLADKYPASLYKIESTQTDTTETPPITASFTPVSFQTYSTNFYDGVTLTKSFPNTFYLNEIYYFTGTLNVSSDTAFIFLNSDPGKSTNYLAEISGKNFTIPVVFRQAGNFKMGLIPGSSGESKIVEISVLPDLPSNTNVSAAPAAVTPSINFKNDKTTVAWTQSTNELVKINFTQGTKKKSFYLRQDKNFFAPDYVDFEEFTEGSTKVSVQKAKMSQSQPLKINSPWSATSEKSFNAITHQYKLNDLQYLTYSTLPETGTKNVAITFNGTAKTNLYQEAAVITPSGNVEKFNLTSSKALKDYYGSKIISSGSDYKFTYTPVSSGTYIIEINDSNGSAVINTPVYVSTGTPLTPDYFDVNEYADTLDNFNLTSSRDSLLNLVNEERTKMGLTAVKIDANLNQLAQLHSEDMKKRDFFGHINPDGESPEDRRIKLGLPMPVGENLAISPTVPYAHYGLMRSAIHRENIIEKGWTKVGIGIVQDSNGSLIITEEFSNDPFTESSLNTGESGIISDINILRTSKNLASLTKDATLQTIAEEWTTKMATENFFDFSSPNGDTLSDTVNKYSTKQVQAFILQSSTMDKLSEQIMASKDVISSSWTKIGIDIKLNATGTIRCTVLFSVG